MDILSDLNVKGCLKTDLIVNLENEHIEFGKSKFNEYFMFCGSWIDLGNSVVTGSTSKQKIMVIPENCTKFAVVCGIDGVPLIQAYSTNTNKMVYFDYELTNLIGEEVHQSKLIASTQTQLSAENRKIRFVLI